MKFGSGKTGNTGNKQDHVFDEFLEDVENDMRLEKYEQVWKKYGKLISAAATVLIAAGILFGFWYKYRESKHEELARQFVIAQNIAENGNLDKALSMMSFLATENVGKYPFLAKMSRAGLLTKKDFDKNIEEIKGIYKAIYSDSGAPIYIKHLAIILYVNAALQEHKTLTKDQAAEALSLLRTCHNKNNDGLFLLAKEMEGVVLYLIGDFEEARKAYDTISKSSKTPEGMLSRTRIMIQAVQNKLSEETTKAGVAGEETINVNEKTAGSENNGNDNNGGKEE